MLNTPLDVRLKYLIFLKLNSSFSLKGFFCINGCSTESKGLYSLTIITKFKHKCVFASSSKSHNLSLQASFPILLMKMLMSTKPKILSSRENYYVKKKTGSLYFKKVKFPQH